VRDDHLSRQIHPAQDGRIENNTRRKIERRKPLRLARAKRSS
jgi:hypothetical protein